MVGTTAFKARRDRRANLCAALVVLSGISWLLYQHQLGSQEDPEDSALIARVSAKNVQSVALPSADSDGSESLSTANEAAAVLSGHDALLLNIEILRRGYQKLQQIPAYTATFFRQERVDQRVHPAQVMQMKVRHQPFSVYLKWLVGSKGREVLYVDGQRENRMLVKLGGWKSRLLPSLKIEPDGAVAMRGSRYPVTDIGLLKLCQKLLDHRQRDLERGDAVVCCWRQDAMHDDRLCYVFELEYTTSEFGQYRKSVQYIDKQWELPVSIQNFTWPAEDCHDCDDETTLLESYSFSDLHFIGQLPESAFDRKNSQYGFYSRR